MTDARPSAAPGAAQDPSPVLPPQTAPDEAQNGAQACEWCGRAIVWADGCWRTAKRGWMRCDDSPDHLHDPGAQT